MKIFMSRSPQWSRSDTVFGCLRECSQTSRSGTANYCSRLCPSSRSNWQKNSASVKAQIARQWQHLCRALGRGLEPDAMQRHVYSRDRLGPKTVLGPSPATEAEAEELSSSHRRETTADKYSACSSVRQRRVSHLTDGVHWLAVLARLTEHC